MNLLTSDKEYAEFGKEFLRRFLEEGYGTYSKSDLQDLLLYLANRASSSRFLDAMSNYELSKVLKIPDTKVKTLRLNIALKFYTSDEGKLILRRYFERILDGRVKLDADEKTYQFYIENNVDRLEIENELKQTGVTLNYLNNREIGVLKKEHFFEMLKNVAGRSENDLYTVIYKHLKKEEFKKKAGNVFEKIGEFATDFTKDILKEVIKEMLIPGKV